MATVTEKLLTAEAYRQLPDVGQPTELVRGKVVPMNMPGSRHGKACARVSYYLQRYLEDHDVGHVMSNDTGVITERGPDTVRGADVAFYSYERIPKDQVPDGYPQVAPEVVVEVRSPSDRWSDLLEKVSEYLKAGVNVVLVVDSESETVQIFREKQPALTLKRDDTLTLAEVPGEFTVPVAQLFQ